MTEESSAGKTSEGGEQIAFLVKSSNDTKYPVSVPATTTIADLKNILSGSSYADTPADRQRLIFSGRVLKDTDTVAGAKIKEGHTVHLVKSAASNVRQNPAQIPSASGTPAPAANVPTNIAAGTGHNPLAALTGARYAGFHGLPSLQSFGADGGMSGGGMNPDDLERMLENPNFMSQMNEMMDSPAFQQMLLDNPMFRDNPMARQLIRDPNYRRMLLNPNLIRSNLRAQQQMESAMNRSNFPAPGQTDNTGVAQNQGAGQTQGQGQAQNQNFASPFGGFNFGDLPAGDNPFASLFQPPAPGTTTSSADATGNTPTAGAPGGAFSPDFFRAMGGLGGATAGQGATPGSNPNNSSEMFEASMRLMQNPDFQRMTELMRSDPNGPFAGAGNLGAFGGAGGGAGAGAGAGAGGDGGAGGFNPWASLMAPQQASSPAPADTRPPEERYADQLRQLNDMGFIEFERNIEALRRSGGSVQGAIEYLLSAP